MDKETTLSSQVSSFIPSTIIAIFLIKTCILFNLAITETYKTENLHTLNWYVSNHTKFEQIKFDCTYKLGFEILVRN